jgi:hypothetical protein
MIRNYRCRGRSCHGQGRNLLKDYSECWSLYSLSNSAACSRFDSGSHILSAVG